MRFFTPEVAWHNRDPVFSVDIQQDKVSNHVYRLASGGADAHIVVRVFLLKFIFTYTIMSDYNIGIIIDLVRRIRYYGRVKRNTKSRFCC